LHSFTHVFQQLWTYFIHKPTTLVSALSKNVKTDVFPYVNRVSLTQPKLAEKYRYSNFFLFAQQFP